MSVAVSERRSGFGIPLESILLGIALFLVIAATNILTPLLPDIRKDFGITIAYAGVIVGSYGLARLVTDLPAGWIIDSVGHARVSVIGLALLLVACVVGFNASSVEMLIAARIAGGIAVAILSTVVLAALGASASNADRGKVMSLFHVANNTGIALYPLIGGIVGGAFGWRTTFGVTAGLTVVAGVLLLFALLRVRPRRGAGRATKAGDERVLQGRERATALLATNAGVVANMINRHGFRNTILPLYAATSLGLGGVPIAAAIALMSITGLTVATPGGMLGDRIGRRRIIMTGLFAIAVGDVIFLLVTRDVVTFLVAAALIGFGDFFSSSQTALLSEIVPAAQRTKSLSGYRFASDLGAFIGPVLLAGVMDLVSGGNDPKLGAQAAIGLAAGVLILASFAERFFVPARVDDRPERAPAVMPVLKGATDEP